jgi:hypothetical protein
MRLIPIHCDSCDRSALIGTSAISNGGTSCPGCGKPARPLPGESYGESDLGLFKDLEDTLREAQLSSLNASRLATELDDRNRHPGLGLKRIARLLPSLSILELIVSDDQPTMRKAEGILATLLAQIAARRSSESGEIAVMGALRTFKAGHGLL